MADDYDKCIGCCSCCTIFTYIVGFILCWVFSRALYPESNVALAGAIIVSIPVIAILGTGFICYKVLGHEGAVGGMVIAGGCFAAVYSVFGFIGTLVLIVASAEAHSKLGDDGAAACGGIAAALVAVSAVTNLSSCIGVCGSVDEQQSKKEPRDDYVDD